MKIDTFTLQPEGEIDWKELKDKPTLAGFREALAQRKLEHFLRLRSSDHDMAQVVKGRIAELEELLSLTDESK